MSYVPEHTSPNEVKRLVSELEARVRALEEAVLGSPFQETVDPQPPAPVQEKQWRNFYSSGEKSERFVTDPDGIMQSMDAFRAWLTAHPEEPHQVS